MDESGVLIVRYRFWALVGMGAAVGAMVVVPVFIIASAPRSRTGKRYSAGEVETHQMLITVIVVAVVVGWILWSYMKGPPVVVERRGMEFPVGLDTEFVPWSEVGSAEVVRTMLGRALRVSQVGRPRPYIHRFWTGDRGEEEVMALIAEYRGDVEDF